MRHRVRRHQRNGVERRHQGANLGGPRVLLGEGITWALATSQAAFPFIA
jgi:hypothetical protein